VIVSRWPRHPSWRDEKANFGRLFYGNAGGWHDDRLPGLVLGIRDVLEALKAAVEAREVTGFKDDKGMSAHGC
jgi:hypothetical protein